MRTLLIYGATGYTGRMAAQRAKALGRDFEVAERDHARPIIDTFNWVRVGEVGLWWRALR